MKHKTLLEVITTKGLVKERIPNNDTEKIRR